MSETENPLDRDPNDSDDGFEVVDPEPEEEPEDVKYLSRTSSTGTPGTVGTIIFCHLHDEYNSFKEVKCEYIRPEGWTEQENDVVAIFEVSWTSVDQAVAKLPVDPSISRGFLIGSVNLTGVTFRPEDLTECAGAVSHFQFCYLRDGMVLGASTPFTIRGIRSARRLPFEEKPLFVPSSLQDLISTSIQDLTLRLPASPVALPGNNYSSLETASGNSKHNHDKFFIENEAAYDIVDGSANVELSALQSTVRNLTALTKRLQNRNLYDRESKYTPELIVKLRESVDELSAEMHKAAGDLPSVLMTQSSSTEDLEERFRNSAAQLKANVQGCTRTFDMCKVAIKTQTPPSSLSEHEMSHFIREMEWKRQQESEQLQKLQRTEEELKQFKEEASLKEREQEKKLQKAEEELQQFKETASVTVHEQLEKLQRAEEELQQFKEEASRTVHEQLEKLQRADEELQQFKVEASMTVHEQLEKLQKAEEELQQFKEEAALREHEQQEKLQRSEEELEQMKEMFSFKQHEYLTKLVNAEGERRTLQEELARKETSYFELRMQFEDVQADLKTEVSLKDLLKRTLKETQASLERTKAQLQQEEQKCQVVQRTFDDLQADFKIIQEELSLEDEGLHELKKQIQVAKLKTTLKDTQMTNQMETLQKQMQDMMEELSLKEMNHQNYVAEAEKEKKQTAALAEAYAVAKSQNQSLLDEAKLYKSKLGDTIVELTNTRQQADSLKEQCAKFVQDLSFMETEKERLMACISNLRKELEKKEQSSHSGDAQHDVLVQEFLKKSEELNVAHQQITNLQEELSRLNAQRRKLLKDLQDAQEGQRKATTCERPCCAFDITPGQNQPDHVVDSVLEALEQSHRQNKELETQLETEKKRAQGLEEKLQDAAGKQRSLFMEKITLEAKLRELLGSN